MSLERVRRSGRGTDGAAEEHVVAEHEIRRQTLAQHRRIRLDPAVELSARAVLEELDLVALVAVEDEDGQEPADVRPQDLRSAEVVALGVRLLAYDRDLVPPVAPLARKLPRVDVRPGSAEQVPVPEEDAHRGDATVQAAPASVVVVPVHRAP